MKKTTIWKRMLALSCAAVLGISLAACGSVGESNEAKNTSGNTKEEHESEYVYVSEFTNLNLEEGTYLGSAQIMNGVLYCESYEYDEATGQGINSLVQRNLNTGEMVKTPKTLDAGEGREAYMNSYTIGQDGSMYAVWNISPVWEEGKEYNYNDQQYCLVKTDSQGNQVYRQDITETMKADEMNNWIQSLVVDATGRLYASSENMVRIFGEDGSFLGTVEANGNWIVGLSLSKDGRVFLCQQGSEMELAEIMADTLSLGEAYKNLPQEYNSIMIPGFTDDIIICGSNTLYGYNFAEQTSREILNWSSCNVIGSNIRNMTVMEDGSFIAVCEDYETNTTELVHLSQKLRSQVPEKKTIVLGTFNSNQNVQKAVVSFNKRSQEYMIEIEEYSIEYQDNWTPQDYDNAVAQFNTSLVGENAPDIIELGYNVDVGNLVSKGALVDLNPYLEESTLISREDFVEGVLNAHTVNGMLITIPRTVQLATLLGRTEMVGKEPGWTLQEIISFSEEHPDAELLPYATKDSILETIMKYSFDTFVDYEAGTCSFNSQEFKDVLTFANRFVQEYDYDNNGPSFPKKIQSGQMLLSSADVHNTQAYQMYSLMFETEVTNIGYPTFDGSLGTFMQGSEMYGIFANSEYKDGAWQFIESIHQYQKPNERGAFGFPTRKDELEETFAYDMTPEYQLDEKGEKILDENGEPLQHPKTSWGYDDWDTDIFAASQEDVDAIMEMMDAAKSVLLQDDTVFTMIQEEAQYYFSGQKTVDQVAEVIQSRVGVYVSENY